MGARNSRFFPPLRPPIPLFTLPVLDGASVDQHLSSGPPSPASAPPPPSLPPARRSPPGTSTPSPSSCRTGRSRQGGTRLCWRLLCSQHRLSARGGGRGKRQPRCCGPCGPGRGGAVLRHVPGEPGDGAAGERAAGRGGRRPGGCPGGMALREAEERRRDHKGCPQPHPLPFWFLYPRFSTF